MPEPEKYRPVIAVLNSRYPREIAIAIYKLASCWDYNSCDHDPCKQDLVWQEIKKIQEKAMSISGLNKETIYENIEYDIAPWVYCEKDWKKYIFWVRERKNQNKKDS